MNTSILSFRGIISRRKFALTSLFLVFIKFMADKFVASNYGRPWFVTNYFWQPEHLSLRELTPEDQKFYLTLIILALPFVWMGVALCMKRLRDAALPLWLTALFFLPFVNLLFFALLCIIPSAGVERAEDKPLFLYRLIPKSETGSILFSIGITVGAALLFTVFSVDFMREYGWGVFIAIPFFIGFTSVLLFSYHHQPVSPRQAISIGITSVGFFALFLLGLAMEGIICIAMALPIGLVLAVIGALAGCALQFQPPKASLYSIAAFVFLMPVLIWVEKQITTQATLCELKTSIVVNSSAEEVWKHLVSFSRIDAPDEFIFKTGIAYPIDATIIGTGKGAIRHCNFTTGSFVEPITVWNEPTLLKFDVLQQPQPMVEMSFYDHVNALHLEGYFSSQKGQFRLEKLNENQTLLEGTTWYKNEMWPAIYWKQWSDFILHKIHYRVLKHIKMEAEKQG